MRASRRAVLPLLAAPLWARVGPAAAQAGGFPNKPIRVIVPFANGSGADTNTRYHAEELSKLLGQPVVVENRPGGNGAVGIGIIKQSPADGYTMLTASNSPMSVNPHVLKSLPYDPATDLRPVAGLFRGLMGFMVAGDSRHKSLQDLLDASRREKRKISVGTYSQGYQLAAAWWSTLSGAELNYVAYKGLSQAMTDLIGGQIDLAVVDLGGALPLAKDGKARALAVTGDSRSPELPDVPTMQQLGFKDFATYTWCAFYVNAATPDDIVDKLADAMQKVLNTPAARDYAVRNSWEQMPLAPAAMREFQQADSERYRQIAEAARIEKQ
ncbi:MAG: tripartite tricarboxylate transporter substrate binding protein [Burkholderiaceae bacterium]